MNDVDYRAKEFKKIANSAKHRVGRRRRGCTLPSDNLTAAQKRRMNGPVKTYNLREPKSWATFKRMPHDIQTEYLTWLMETFRVDAKMIAEMGGVKPDAVRRYLGDHDLPRQRRGATTRLTPAEENAWRAFLMGHGPEDATQFMEEAAKEYEKPETDEAPEHDVYAMPVPLEEDEPYAAAIQSLALDFTVNSWEGLVRFIRTQAMDGNTPLRVQLRVEVLDGETA